MLAAADRLFESLDRLAALGRPPLVAFLDGRPFVQWEHYPEGDLFDPDSGVLVFYHAHAPDDRDAAENGHFHCFVARARLRRRAKPLARGARGERALCHVAGVSVDAEGVPRELFTTSQPVTGEWFYPAEAVTTILPAFAQLADDAPPAAQWLASIVTLFEPEIARLLRERDARLCGTAGGAVNQENAPEILSSAPIDIDARLEALGKL